MGPAAYFALFPNLLPFVVAIDTAIALYASSNCASAEKPLLVIPGSDILSGNCVADLGTDWTSTQAISLDGDCSINAYFDGSCSTSTAAVGVHECIFFDTQQLAGIPAGLPIQSFKINGGNCKLPGKAVVSTSAEVPAASTTRPADPLNTIISTGDGSAKTEATTQTSFDFGTSETGTGTIENTGTPSTASSAAGGHSDSSEHKLSTILAATIIPLGAISVLGLLWYFCCWRPSRNRRKEHVSLSTSTSSSTQSAAYTGASASEYARQHNGNVTNTTNHYYGDGRHPSRNQSPASPDQINGQLR